MNAIAAVERLLGPPIRLPGENVPAVWRLPGAGTIGGPGD
jgi:hypothetical protein